MPVYIVCVNAFGPTGRTYMPELVGVIASQDTPDGALDTTIDREVDFDVRDTSVQLVSNDDRCWVATGPETAQ